MATNKWIVIVLMILMCLLGLVFIQESFGFPNEPTGFRGNDWGTPVGEIDCGLKLATSIDKLKFEAYTPDIEFKVFDVMLLFLDGKLAGYSMCLKDLSTVDMFLVLCCETFGEPTSESYEFAAWESEDTIVELDLYYGIIVMGSMLDIRSLEALFEWYESQGGRISPESKPNI